jgi:putative membrane fusion protein
MKNKAKSINKKNIFAYIFIAAVIGLFIIIYVLPNVSDVFRQTVVIEYGGIQVKDKVTCFIIRDETVYFAETQGEIEYFVNEGDQIRKGTKVLETITNRKAYIADKRGMVSYYIDGLESYFKPDTMISLKYEDTKKLKLNMVNTKSNKIESGKPIYKIINGNTWYVVYWIDKESILNYEKGNKVKLLLPKSSVQGIVSDIIQKEDAYFIILKFDRYYDGLTELRKINAEAITSDYRGLTIPNECITTSEEITGVYVKDVSGEFIFKPVKVLTSDGINSLVECTYYYENTPEGQKKIETVDIYDEVLRKI